jgi:hypothetical protein
MASPKQQLQKLHDTLAELEAELEALKNKKAGVQLAIDVLERDDGGEETADDNGRARRGAVKEALFELLKEAGKTGLNAHSAVEMAKRRGLELDRGTVSSTLSRMKRDGAVDHDGERYRLKAPDQQVAA